MRNPFKGFFEKRNRHATPRSVAMKASIGAVSIAALFYCLAVGLPGITSLGVVGFTASGAIVGAVCLAALEWQGPC